MPRRPLEGEGDQQVLLQPRLVEGRVEGELEPRRPSDPRSQGEQGRPATSLDEPGPDQGRPGSLGSLGRPGPRGLGSQGRLGRPGVTGRAGSPTASDRLL